MEMTLTEVVERRLADRDAGEVAIENAVKCTITPKDALELVNGIRAALALDPLDDLPPGQTGDPNHCVLANALSAGKIEATVAGSITLDGLTELDCVRLELYDLVAFVDAEAGTAQINDEIVGKFIGLFDGGQLEKYEEGAE